MERMTPEQRQYHIETAERELRTVNADVAEYERFRRGEGRFVDGDIDKYNRDLRRQNELQGELYNLGVSRPS